MKTRVVHLKHEPYDVAITRNGEWGNPFIIGQDGTRSEVLDLYRAWLINHPSVIVKARRLLKGKILGCWCKPRACHGDILVEFIHQRQS